MGGVERGRFFIFALLPPAAPSSPVAHSLFTLGCTGFVSATVLFPCVPRLKPVLFPCFYPVSFLDSLLFALLPPAAPSSPMAHLFFTLHCAGFVLALVSFPHVRRLKAENLLLITLCFFFDSLLFALLPPAAPTSPRDHSLFTLHCAGLVSALVLFP